jgi:hypothetical protein
MESQACVSPIVLIHRLWLSSPTQPKLGVV